MLSARAECFANNENFTDSTYHLIRNQEEFDQPGFAGKFIPWLKTQLREKQAIVVLIKADAENARLLTPLLGDQELERANSYLHTNDKHLSIAAHGLKRLLLAELLGISTDELQFDITAKGKPICVNQQALAFNISHSQQWAAIVIAQDMQVGVDIEFPRAMDYAAFADSALSKTEYNEFKQRNYETHFFLERWSQKEAISKACGLGLFLDFKTINTHKINQTKIHGIHYYFYSKEFSSGCISIATNVEQKKLQIISFEQIKHQFTARRALAPCKL